MKKLWIGLLLAGAVTGAVAVAGCQPKEGPAEKAGKSIDNAGDDIKEAVKDVERDTKEAVKDVKEDINDATDD